MTAIPFFDGHCDTIYRCLLTGAGFVNNGGHVDLSDLRPFSCYAQVFTFFWSADKAPPEGMLSRAKDMYALFRRELDRHPDKLRHCKTAADIASTPQGMCSAILSLEGADLLECDPENLTLAHDWGVRMVNLTWNCPNAISGSCCRDSDRGLSALGRAFVREAGRQGIYVDVSHLSHQGFWDLVEITEKPIIASHSNAMAVYPNERSLTDDQFRAIRDTGGTVGLNLYTGFVGQSPTMDDFIRHIEHFLHLDGEDTIALGTDFDGCEEMVDGISHLTHIPRIYQALTSRGWEEALLEKLFWKNWMKLM